MRSKRNNMNDPFLHIIPATQDLVDRLVVPAAKADGVVGVFCATQVLVKNNEVVGYLSINAVPTVLCWLHKTKMYIRDSIAVGSFIENYVQNVCNSNLVIVPSPSNGPLSKYLKRVGYAECEGDVVFMKNLTLINKQLKG